MQEVNDPWSAVCPPFIIGTGKNMGTLFCNFYTPDQRDQPELAPQRLSQLAPYTKAGQNSAEGNPHSVWAKWRHNIIIYSYVDWTRSKEEWGGGSGDSGGGGGGGGGGEESLSGEKYGVKETDLWSLHTNLPTTSIIPNVIQGESKVCTGNYNKNCFDLAVVILVAVLSDAQDSYQFRVLRIGMLEVN